MIPDNTYVFLGISAKESRDLLQRSIYRQQWWNETAIVVGLLPSIALR